MRATACRLTNPIPPPAHASCPPSFVADKVALLEHTVAQLAGRPVNLQVADDIHRALFTDLALPHPPRADPTRPAQWTSTDNLRTMQHLHPAVPAIIEHRCVACTHRTR